MTPDTATSADAPDIDSAEPPAAAGAPAPIPVLALEYEPPTPVAARARTWHRIAAVCLALAWIGCVAAVLSIAAHTESVVVTGPMLFTLGVLALLGGFFAHDRLAAVIGACHCGVCVLFFVLVNALSWSPGAAHTPFLVMGTAYTMAVAFPTGLFFVRRRGARQVG